MIDKKSLLEIHRKSAKENIPVYFVSGCFDLLHLGHIRFLNEAKGRNSLLAVGVLADAFVKSRKGDARPIFNERTRLACVRALRMVDYAFILKKDETENTLKQLKPHKYFIGGDRKGKVIPELPILKKFAIPVAYTRAYGDRSTTKIISLIKKK